MELPLSRQTVLLSRPAQQSEPLLSLLQDAGATVLVQPTIEILPPDSWDTVDSAIREIENYDWVIFSSSNGARFFTERTTLLRGGIFRSLPQLRIAAVGPGTAKTLENLGLENVLVPKTHTAEGLVELLSPFAAQNRRFLSIRASRGRDILAPQLEKCGGKIDEIVAYKSLDWENVDPKILEMMQTSKIQWVTATSSSIAMSLFRMFGDSLHNPRIISISHITTQALKSVGVTPFAEAEIPTMEGIFKKLLFSAKNADRK